MELFEVVIKTDTLEKLQSLDKLELDIVHRAAERTDEKSYSVPGLLSKTDIDNLIRAGFDVTISRALGPVALDRQSQVSKFNRFENLQTDVLDASLTVQGYLTNEEIDSVINNFAAANSDIVTRIELPFLTWEGRRSYAVRLRAGTKTIRTGVLFTGGMHAREWGGADICVSFMLTLVNAYKLNQSIQFGGRLYSSGQVKMLLEELEVFVFPNVNPDGRNYSQYVNTWWRKNRNPNGGGPAGVDLNRNFDYLWSSGIGTSGSKSSEVYKGSAPFSEPETRNVKYIIDTYQSVRYYLDIHSYSGLILYNWGDDDNQNTSYSQNFQNAAYNGMRGVAGDTVYREFISTLDENTAKEMARRMHDALLAVRGKNYTVSQSMGLYPTSATSGDFSLSRSIISSSVQKVFGFTIEFGNEFIPPIAEMNLIKSDVNSAMTELCLTACSDVFMADNEVDSGAVPTSAPFWNSPDIWIRNKNDSGTVHQNTIRGRDNYVYLRVRNRGTGDAFNLKVRAYITTWAGTEFNHPADWIPLNPGGGGSITSQGTYLIGEMTIPNLPSGGVQTVSMKWQASLIPPETEWHPCILAEVSPNDGPFCPGTHVWNNNNLVQKNITIVNPVGQRKITFPFMAGRIYDEEKLLSLELRKIKCPVMVKAALVFDQSRRNDIKSVEHFKILTTPGKAALILDPDANIGRVSIMHLGKGRIPVKLVVDVPKSQFKNQFLFEIIQSDNKDRKVGGVLYQINLPSLFSQGKSIPLSGGRAKRKS